MDSTRNDSARKDHKRQVRGWTKQEWSVICSIPLIHQRATAVLSALNKEPAVWKNNSEGILPVLKTKLESLVDEYDERCRSLASRRLEWTEGWECYGTPMISTIWSLLDHPDFPIFNIPYAAKISRKITATAAADAAAVAVKAETAAIRAAASAATAAAAVAAAAGK